MTLKELIHAANTGYLGDLELSEGDTLSQFIVNELTETFDPDASDAEQVYEAHKALGNAVKELNDIRNALLIAQSRRLDEQTRAQGTS